MVGHPLADGDRVVIVEDVTTAGTSIRDTVPLLRASAEVVLAGLIVSVDRGERGTGERTALAEIREAYGMPTFAIVTIEEVITHLHGREIDGRVPLDDRVHARMLAYLDEHRGRS
jgi:orotate phosphoribosyltransferase